MIWLAAFLAVLGTGTWLGARRLATDVDAIGAASALAAGIMLLRGVAIALGLGAAVLIILGI